MSAKINVNGKAINEFKIVYSESDIYAAKVFAYRLQKLLAKEYDLTVEVVSDDTPEVDNEIVVGNTNRGTVGASETAFSIVADGGKLYFNSPKSVGYEYVYSTVDEDIKNGAEYANGYSFVKELSEVLKDGSKNAISRVGDLRIMYNNVWIFEMSPPGSDTPELIAPAPFRAKLLADVYRDYKPAILGLQEYGAVSCNKYMINEELKPLVEALGYKELYSNNSAQLALFYDPKLLRLKSFGLHQFTEGDTSRGVLWGIFVDKATNNSFICATTHFAWAPVWEQACAYRIIHAQQTVKLLKSLYEIYNLPIILGGDFNQDTAAMPHKILQEAGLVNVATLVNNPPTQHTLHPYPHFNSTEDCVPEKVFRPTAPFMHGLDHIYTYQGDSLQFETQAVVYDWFALASTDHCPVVADFSFKKND